MKWRERPVIILGHGARLSGADCPPLLEIGVPILTSWMAKDLVDNTHPMYFGSPGVYGQRMANHVLYNADQIIALGNRLSLWNAGHTGIREDQELWMCDADSKEVERHKHAIHIHQSLKTFIESLSQQRADCKEWLERCEGWKTKYPLLEAAHEHEGYVNTYLFTSMLEKFLAEDEVIVTDAGTLMCPAFQVLQLKPPQRLITSGGLGEMGCGLPLAIGASFARNKGRVICLVGDGGMMLNLQELATISHHRLPIKIIVFNNDGYTMIKHSQKALGYVRSGVDKSSGVSTPSFYHLGHAFQIPYSCCDYLNIMEPELDWLMNSEGPAMLELVCDPEQVCVPKLNPVRNEDGTIGSPRFSDMEPVL